jgi:NAD-dependent SIR2 family protein deacetylase/transcription initiation factor IIF auxiliary subunit
MDASKIVIGNTSRQISSESWEWSLYVNCITENIKEVVIHLHPTFQPNTFKLEKTKKGKFESKAFTGWGTFNVKVDVHWNDGEINKFEHFLVFEGDGKESKFDLELLNQDDQNENMEIDENTLSGAEFTFKRLKIKDASREEVRKKLSKTGFQEHSSTAFWHGRLYAGDETVPKITWKSHLTPRNDHDAPKWLTASEYCDVSDVLETKLDYLAQLFKLSQRTVIYTGAGISRAAGIGQAARGGGKDAGKGMGKGLDALPTFTHYALGALAKAGYIHNWVQQNHDGLPQKAGFPQESINEIHGSWYDPSNPVVLYSGNLKAEQYPWMVEYANTADLVLVLGTSLGGLNADQVPIKTAERSRNDKTYHSGGALGTVMINLQQTEHDGKSTIRIFGESDDIMGQLLEKLEVPTPTLQPSTFDNDRRVLVPYDANGKLSNKVKTWLDLRDGAHVKLTQGHNCQGAKQPAYLHIGADEPVAYHRVMRKNGPGHGKVVKQNNNTVGIELSIEGQIMVLGQWWIEAALRGGPRTLPVVNINPEIHDA